MRASNANKRAGRAILGAPRSLINGLPAFDVFAPVVVIGQVPLELMDWVVDSKGQRLIGNPEHGGEQGVVGGSRGVEGAGRAAVAIAHRLPETVEGPLGRGGIVDDGQGIEVPMIGRSRHGGAARMITATRGGDGADRVTAVECARRPALARISAAPAGAGGGQW